MFRHSVVWATESFAFREDDQKMLLLPLILPIPLEIFRRFSGWGFTLSKLPTAHSFSTVLLSKMRCSRPFARFPLNFSLLTTWLSLLPAIDALGMTDTITWGGSNDRTSYQSNHNMVPAIVGSPQFGLLFKTLLPGTYRLNGQDVPEQIFSLPLVYTGSDEIQYVYIATTQNNAYKMNAKTGIVVASRNLHRPFLVSDLDGCTDINPLIGVTATGVIDPATVRYHHTSSMPC